MKFYELNLAMTVFCATTLIYCIKTGRSPELAAFGVLCILVNFIAWRINRPKP